MRCYGLPATRVALRRPMTLPSMAVVVTANSLGATTRPCSILIESKLGPNLLFYRDFRAVKCSISLEITLINLSQQVYWLDAGSQTHFDKLSANGCSL